MEMMNCAPVLLGEVGVALLRHAISSLAFMMVRCAYVLAYNCQAGKGTRGRANPGVEAITFGTFSARLAVVKGVESMMM